MTFWVLFLIILVLFFVWFCRKEGFKGSNYRALNPSETRDFLLSDVDGYIQSLSPDDLAARGFANKDEYINYLKNAEYVECPNLENVIEEADALIDRLEDSWLNKEKLQALPWIIAISPARYEFNLPHTRGQVIMLPLSSCSSDNGASPVGSDNGASPVGSDNGASPVGSDNGASPVGSDNGASPVGSDTLVHEKLHVYQKTYPKDFEKYLKKEGFQICKRRFNRSANPDADKQIYERDGVPWYGYYKKGGGKGFQSIRYTPINMPRYDCPREYAVYTLLDRFT
jgi:hypothetical protein